MFSTVHEASAFAGAFCILGAAMQVRVLDENDEVIWSQGKKSGMTYLSHRKDGTLEKIIAALESATEVAKQELESSSHTG